MKQKLLLALLALFTLGGSNLYAQTDVTSTYLTNADFSTGTPIDNNVCTYGKDMEANGTTYYGAQAINGWTNASVGATDSGYENSQLAGALFAYGSTPWLAGSGTTAPATDPDGNTGNAAGLCAVWGGSIQYTQDVTLPAGSYTVRFKVFNATAGSGKSSGIISTDLFGFVENDGTTHYAPNNTFAIGQWVNIAVSFKLSAETAGKISMGYVGPKGNADMPHLFVDNVKILKNEMTEDCTSKVNSTGWTGASDGYQGGTINTARQYGDKSVGRHIYQTVSGLDNGMYEVALYAISQKEWTGSLANDAGDVAYVLADGAYELKEWINARSRAGYPEDDNVGIYTISGVKVTNGTLTLGIGLAQANLTEWHHIQIKSLVRTNGVDLSDLKSAYAAALAAAQEAFANDNYANVTGSEKTVLQNEIGKAEPTSAEDYEKAITDLTSATNAFIAAKPNYDALVAEIAYAKTIGVDEKTADEFAATNQSTAETVVVNTQNLKVAEYTHIKETYTEDATLGTWTEDFAEDLNGEGYVDNGPTYWNEWGTNTRTANQTVTLPAGEYAISCIARGQVGTFGHMYYKIGTDETTVDFIMKGNRGRGVDTNKEANFSGDGTYTCNNEGFGWEYRYLTFKLTQETEVEIGVSAKFTSQWVSIYAPNLFTTEASVKALRLAEIAEAINNVPTGNMYKDVKSRLDAKVAAANNASANNTKDELTAILNELNDAIAAANASIAEYEEISKYLATSQTNFDGDYSTISTAITNGDYEHEADGIAAVKVLRNTYATASMSDNTDLTALIDNNDFELGNTKYWTVVNSSDTGVRETTNDTYRMSNSHGNYLFNTWWQGTPITQNIGKLPAGAYEMKGVVASDGGTIYITMNNRHEAFVETAGAKDNSNIAPTKVGIEFSYVFTLDAETDVTIGVIGGADGDKGSHKTYSENGYWFYKADNFRLTYLGATAPANALDGTYYFETASNKINRGGDSGTEAVMNEVGIPMIITTDKAGISTIKFSDTGKYMMFNDEMVYTDGTIDPNKVYHKPYWKIEAVSGGYQILNTESGLYLATTTANRDGNDITVATASKTPAVWTLTDAILDVAKNELKDAIDAIVIPTTNVGDAAFQIPTAQVTAATQAKAEAQSVYENDAATMAEIDAAKAALETAMAKIDLTTLNVPEPTQAYNLVFNCEGHSATGNALTLIPNPAQTQGFYGLKYLAPANVNLAQAFYFTHTTGNKYKVHAIDTDLNERYITTQAEGYGTTWYDGIRTIDDASKAMEIEIRPNGEGLYLLWNTGANKAMAHNGNNNNDLFTNNTANFQFVETTKPSITINTEAAGWGTTILPFAVSEIPEGVKLYSCSKASNGQLTLVEETTLEANKPYIIEGTWKETLTGDAQGTELKNTVGLLTGTYVNMTKEELLGNYIMQKQGDKVGFFKVDGKANPSLRANRAYLTVTEDTEVKAFYLDDETNSISAIEALARGNAEIFNINGVKQNSLQKGINIIKTADGKIQKIMVK